MLSAKRLALRSPSVRWPLLAAAVFLGVALAPARAERLPLPPELQEKVNDAIDFGVIFLRKTQLADGCWEQPGKSHRVGYTALPALTLLECGEPKTEPEIQRAAVLIRRGAADLDTTYELALSILFLDRLGEPRDRKIIQMLALRLVAGQTMTGGWSYKCPLLGPRNQKDLLTVLQKMNPRPALPLMVGDKPAGPEGVPALPANPGLNPTGPAVSHAASGTTTTPGGSLNPSGTSGGTSPTAPGSTVPAVLPLPPEAAKNPPTDNKADPQKDQAVVIPAALKRLPVLQDPKTHVAVEPRDRGQEPLGTTDNSNTQFAILALWVAQRHDVPMERTMNLIVRRFHTSQNADGSWGYRYRFGGGEGESVSMDCVGLIGLAVGHGLAQAPQDDGAAGPRKKVVDPRIKAGLTALGKHVGTPVGRTANITQSNLYFLWSLERVAVIYDLAQVADKDWYRWGAEMLVANQQGLGFWTAGQYPGASPVLDTCMALLFLKKANLTKDLAGRLPFNPDELGKAPVDTSNTSLKTTPKPTRRPVEPVRPTAPPESVAVVPPPEKSVAPIPPPVQTSTPTPTASSGTEPTGGSSRMMWVWLSLALLLLLALVGGLLLWLHHTHKQRLLAEERRERKAARGPRKSAVRGAASR